MTNDAPAQASVEAIADLIDNLAKCRSENAMDMAFLDNSDEIAAAVLKLIAGRDGEWACTVNRLEDRIEGLNADLDSAVEVAFRRGAVEWTRLNYPTIHMRLSDPAALSPPPTVGAEDEAPVAWRAKYKADTRWRYMDRPEPSTSYDPEKYEVQPLFARPSPSAVEVKRP